MTEEKKNINHKKAIVIGITSDICISLCKDWIDKGWSIVGTYRTKSESLKKIKHQLLLTVECDLSDKQAIDTSSTQIISEIGAWDVLVLGTGLQDPIGPFEDCNFDDWSSSIEINFTNQLRFVHNLIKYRNCISSSIPVVLFFAGGGVNNAPINYSAYISSKIALIKMVELLAAEIPDTRFIIIGPGWVKTKIHNSIINAGRMKAGLAFDRTKEKITNDDFTPMHKVIECCNTLISDDSELLSGRNFSVVSDSWDSSKLKTLIERNPDLYKLRRFGNELT